MVATYALFRHHRWGRGLKSNGGAKEPPRCAKLPYFYFFLVCAKSEAATVFMAGVDFGLLRILLAFDAAFLLVCFVLGILCLLEFRRPGAILVLFTGLPQAHPTWGKLSRRPGRLLFSKCGRDNPIQSSNHTVKLRGSQYLLAKARALAYHRCQSPSRST